jgi:hypothetical protein
MTKQSKGSINNWLDRKEVSTGSLTCATRRGSERLVKAAVRVQNVRAVNITMMCIIVNRDGSETELGVEEDGWYKYFTSYPTTRFIWTVRQTSDMRDKINGTLLKQDSSEKNTEDMKYV